MRAELQKIKDLKNQKGYFRWLARYTRPYLPKIIFLLLLDVFASFVGVYLAVISKNIIDSALVGDIAMSDISWYAVLVLLTIGITATTSLISVVLNERFSFGIRKQIYNKIVNSLWMDIANYHTGDLMTRLTSDASNVANGIVFTMPRILNLTVQLLITFGVLYYYEPMLAFSALIIGPVAAIVSVVLGRKLKRLQEKVQESEARYRSFLQESLANLMIVKAFGNEDESLKQLTILRENRFYWVKKKNLVGVISTMVMSLGFQVGYITAFSFGSYQVSQGLITFGTMTIFLTLVNRIQSPIMQLAKNIPQVVSVLASTGRIIEIQDIPLEEKVESEFTAENIGVDLSDMVFGYNDKDILFDKATSKINPGEFIAIVGESGIGKTTFIRLLMSFLELSEGDMNFFNDQGEVKGVNAAAREFMAYVPQGNTLFSGSIKDNLLMGKKDASDQEIEEALRLASADKFVSELPRGIHTEIGEKGHGVSEGQAQRIAIARALIRKAPFLILDEATSALDDETEIKVLKGIVEAKPRPTCLLITHRRTVLDYCDREIIIKDKKLEIKDLR